MFHITPTPTSWIIWLFIWVVAIVILVGLGSFVYNFSENNEHKTLSKVLIGVMVVVVLALIGMSGSSYYYNYTNSSSYNMAKKNLKIEYDMNQRRTIVVKDFQGKNIYEYTGSFSYKVDKRKIDLTDNKTGNKISVYMGDNDIFIVTDAGIKGEKK